VPFALLVAQAAAAQAPAPAPKVGGSIDFGYVTSSGNTKVTTMSVGQKLTWQATRRFVVRQQLRGIYGEADDKVNANLLEFDVAGDQQLFDGVGIELQAGYDRNRFAGIAKRYEESIGLTWKTTPTKDTLRVTGGVLWTQQRNVQNEDREFVAFRAGFIYKYPFRTGAYVQQAMEAIPSIEIRDDWRLNSETVLVAPVTRRIGLRFAYVVKYDHMPEPNFKDTDRILTAGVQISY
jgi:putative salt-induced outer membrane protein